MKFDLSLQQYVEWEVKNVMPIKGKYGYRVILKYMDGSERPQQKSGFATEKEANAARDKTIGELYAGTYVVYSNVSVEGFPGVLDRRRYPKPCGKCGNLRYLPRHCEEPYNSPLGKAENDGH